MSDDALRAAIREVAGRWPRYGYRWVTAQLRRQGWHLGRSLAHGLTLEVSRWALQTHCPEIHQSDQGVQYAATAYIETLHAHGI